MMASWTSPKPSTNIIILYSLPIFIFSIVTLLIASWYFTIWVDDACVGVASHVSHAFLSPSSIPVDYATPYKGFALMTGLKYLYLITIGMGAEGALADAKSVLTTFSRTGEDKSVQSISMQTLFANEDPASDSHQEFPALPVEWKSDCF